jgi:hypothetical protein
MTLRWNRVNVPGCVFGSGLAGIVRIDILEPELLATGDPVRRYKLLGPFDDFFSIHLSAGS